MEHSTAEWNAILQSDHPNLNADEQKYLQEQTKGYESRYLGRVFTRIVEPLMNQGYQFSKRAINGKSLWKIKRISKSHSTDSTHSTARAENPPSDSSMSRESSVNKPFDKYNPYQYGMDGLKNPESHNG